jgi:hypothetical protein
MEPLSEEQLVEGNRYIRRFRDTGLILPAAAYKGIDPMLTSFYDTLYIKFDAGFDACFIERASNCDLFDEGVDLTVPYYNLNVSYAEHIGDLVEGIDIKLTGEKDPISYCPFVNGESCVQIIMPTQHNMVNEDEPVQHRFVYNENSIQAWFNTGNRSEPKTRTHLRHDMMKRFTYIIPDKTTTPSP